MNTRLLTPIVVAALLFSACSSDQPTANDSAATETAATETTATETTATETPGVTSIPAAATPATGISSTFTAEVWADNWFSLTVNGQLVGEDSVPITTERSFNAESFTFTATYPLTIAMVTKDYKETDSGLEYIGTDRQQMGDGGFVAQITDTATGGVVAATSSAWLGLVVQRAPLNLECVDSADPDSDCRSESIDEPADWTDAGFDDSGWTAASTYTQEEVGTKDGYDTVAWNAAAELIWASDLQVDNTILWRFTAAMSP